MRSASGVQIPLPQPKLKVINMNTDIIHYRALWVRNINKELDNILEVILWIHMLRVDEYGL